MWFSPFRRWSSRFSVSSQIVRRRNKLKLELQRFRKFPFMIMKKSRCIYLSAILFLGRTLVCFGATTENQVADWSELRGGDSQTVRALLQRGVDLRQHDADGNSALHVAALHANAAAIELLLEGGVEVNGTNKYGATPLIYAAGDSKKVRALLAHGADPNRPSLLGTTPLIAAAGYPDSARSLAQLVEAGANVHATNKTGTDALWRASYGGHTEAVKLLLKHGANPNTRPLLPTIQGNIEPSSAPLHNAAYRGESEMIAALLRAGADLNAVEPFAGSALHNALYGNHSRAAALLIERGIDLNLRTAIGEVPTFVWSAYSDVGDTTVARLLLRKNVSLDAANESGETALTWARKRGDNTLAQLFAERGVPDSRSGKQKSIPANAVPPLGTPARRAAIRDATQRSIDLLEVSSTAFLDSSLVKRNDCVSCHQQTLPAVAFSAARERSFRLDEAVLRRQTDAQIHSWSDRIANAYEMDEPQADAPINIGIGLAGLAAVGHKADALTEAFVSYLAATQEKDGSWRGDDFRPPLEDGRVPAVALALRALQLYPIRSREAECRTRIERAAGWIARAEAGTANRLAYKLLGLSWSGSQAAEQRRVARRIMSAQRPDGGWAQLPGLESDAWATGQALFALQESRAVKSDDPVCERGIVFLLRTQFADGSWFVRSRTWPFQPYFDSHFPHGKDQWISAAGTAWSILALLNTLDRAQTETAAIRH